MTSYILTQILAGEKYLIENTFNDWHFASVLTILHIKEDEFGHYHCSVENELGRDSADILVFKNEGEQNNCDEIFDFMFLF